jgi:hypothetical protein
MDWNDGWAWLWMAPTMLPWILLLGVVTHAAVRVATHDSRQH